jgi:hypothetical protein
MFMSLNKFTMKMCLVISTIIEFLNYFRSTQTSVPRWGLQPLCTQKNIHGNSSLLKSKSTKLSKHDMMVVDESLKQLKLTRTFKLTPPHPRHFHVEETAPAPPHPGKKTETTPFVSRLRPRSAGIISRLKKYCWLIFLRENYCFGWKNKLNKTDYKSDEQDLSLSSDPRPDLRGDGQ